MSFETPRDPIFDPERIQAMYNEQPFNESIRPHPPAEESVGVMKKAIREAVERARKNNGG